MMTHQDRIALLSIIAIGLWVNSAHADPTMLVDFEDLSFVSGSSENGITASTQSSGAQGLPSGRTNSVHLSPVSPQTGHAPGSPWRIWDK